MENDPCDGRPRPKIVRLRFLILFAVCMIPLGFAVVAPRYLIDAPTRARVDAMPSKLEFLSKALAKLKTDPRRYPLTRQGLRLLVEESDRETSGPGVAPGGSDLLSAENANSSS